MTTPLLFSGLGTHLARNVFSIMCVFHTHDWKFQFQLKISTSAVCFVLNSLYQILNVPLLCLWGTHTCRTAHVLHLPGQRDVLLLVHPFSVLLSPRSPCYDGGSQCQVPWASCYLVHAAAMGGFHSRKGLNTIPQLLQEVSQWDCYIKDR